MPTEPNFLPNPNLPTKSNLSPYNGGNSVRLSAAWAGCSRQERICIKDTLLFGRRRAHSRESTSISRREGLLDQAQREPQTVKLPLSPNAVKV